jgi:hypothetical protein
MLVSKLNEEPQSAAHIAGMLLALFPRHITPLTAAIIALKMFRENGNHVITYWRAVELYRQRYSNETTRRGATFMEGIPMPALLLTHLRHWMENGPPFVAPRPRRLLRRPSGRAVSAVSSALAPSGTKRRYGSSSSDEEADAHVPVVVTNTRRYLISSDDEGEDEMGAGENHEHVHDDGKGIEHEGEDEEDEDDEDEEDEGEDEEEGVTDSSRSRNNLVQPAAIRPLQTNETTPRPISAAAAACAVASGANNWQRCSALPALGKDSHDLHRWHPHHESARRTSPLRMAEAELSPSDDDTTSSDSSGDDTSSSKDPDAVVRGAPLVIRTPMTAQPKRRLPARQPPSQTTQHNDRIATVRAAVAAAISAFEHAADAQVGSMITEPADLPPPALLAPGAGPLTCLTNSAKAPRPHQASLAIHLLTHRGVIAAHAVGTGKTLMAILTAQCLLANVPSIRRVVIATPMSLVGYFKEELAAYGEHGADNHADQFDILSHESLYSRYRQYCRPPLNPVGLAAAMQRDFSDALLIVDEAHKFRTHISNINKAGGTGRLTYAFLHAAHAARRVLLLTATPMINAPSDIINLVAMVRGDLKPLSAFQFASLRGDALVQYCGNLFSFMDQKDGGGNFPAVHYRDIELTMDQQELAAYMQVERSVTDVQLLEGRNLPKDPMVFLTGLRMAANQPDISKKARFITSTLLAVVGPRRHRRAIVFSQFLQNGLDIIKHELTAVGLTYREITGDMNMAARKRAKDDFDDPTHPVDVMLLSSAGGEGLSFLKVRHIFLFEPAWNRAKQQQAEGRAIRYRSHSELPPAERNVTVYRLTVVKPERAPGLLSADALLSYMAFSKNKEIEQFEARLRRMAVP